MGPDPVLLLKEALTIYSPTAKEGRLASFLSKQMKLLGYSDVRIDRGGNVLGEIGDGKTSILLCGHMDTVPGKLPVRIDSGVLYGRGAADAKSPLCALLVAGSLAADAGAKITFAGVTGEEDDGVGIQTLIKDGSRHDYAVFGEPSGSNRVTIGYRGRVGMRMSLRTEGGHAGSPWAHRNALDEFYAVLKKLRSFEKENTIAGDHFRSISLSPTILKAGTYHNVVPGACDSTFDVRVPPGHSCQEVEDSIREVIMGYSTHPAKTSLRFGEATEPYEADPNSTLVRAFQRAVILKGSSKPVLVHKTGTGDMNTLASSTKVECVTYGPGDSGLSHTDQEQVSLEDYLRSVRVASEAIRQVVTLRARRS